MTEQNLSIEAFNEQLQQWTGKTIKISKQELLDDDATIMNLQQVTYETNTQRIDDYQPMHTLQLNGTGHIENEAHDMQPLPSSQYEIPLEDSSRYQFDGSRFSLTTDRGTYTIEKLYE
ncbi:hypothetical protein [Lentibacillus daqui]|uniref:hypothetical protein n=1 Tax=Lentibacillus daqui TaxID=2911514 RepID=UPI0022B0EBA4|nr:hypothetical protein [Lentibacillus daqui]